MARTHSLNPLAIINQEDFRGPLLLPELLPQAVIPHAPLPILPDKRMPPFMRARPARSARARRRCVSAPLGDGIALLGYDVQPAMRG